MLIFALTIQRPDTFLFGDVNLRAYKPCLQTFQAIIHYDVVLLV